MMIDMETSAQLIHDTGECIHLNEHFSIDNCMKFHIRVLLSFSASYCIWRHQKIATLPLLPHHSHLKKIHSIALNCRRLLLSISFHRHLSINYHRLLVGHLVLIHLVQEQQQYYNIHLPTNLNENDVSMVVSNKVCHFYNT